MRALILAAGVGSRISRHLQHQPKCCVDLDGKPLIKHTMEQLNRHGVKEVALVTGYREAIIHQALEGFRYARYFNPFYRAANSISSAWFARDFLVSDDMLIMNGDVFVEDAILAALLADTRSPVLLSDSTRIAEADFRMQWIEDRVQKYGKQLTNEETTGEYVGMARLSREAMVVFRQRMIDAVGREDYNCWWEEIILRPITEGEVVHVKDIAGRFWGEVDYIEDYERIKRFIRDAHNHG